MLRNPTTITARANGFASWQELLADSPWCPRLANAVQARVLAEMSQQSVPGGVVLSHRGEFPHHW